MSLKEKAILVDLTIGRWGARRADKEAGREIIEKKGADYKAGSFMKNLVFDPRIESLLQIERMAREYHKKNTLPWDDYGSRLLYNMHWEKYIKTMRQFKEASEEMVDEIFSDYENIINQAKEKLGELFNENDYPDKYSVKDKFYFSISFNQISDSSDFRVSLPSRDLEEVKNKIEKEVKSKIRAAVNDAWERLYTVVREFHGKLEKGTKFHESTITSIIELCDLLPNLNIMEDENLDKMSKEVMEKLTNYDPKRLRKNEDGEGDKAKKECEEILKKMEDYMGYCKMPKKEVIKQ